METYHSIKHWKDQNVQFHLHTSDALNRFHDQVMLKVLNVALAKMECEAPCKFVWFITGSGGRFEQGLISDQDHGIIYESSSKEYDLYFKKLGEELSFGMDQVGYPYCKGNIMSSNTLWNQSLSDWKEQLHQWLIEETWESIRYVQIFFDARKLYGDSHFIEILKSTIYQYQLEHSELLQRFAANIMHMKNGIGPLGQWIVEHHGPYKGCINLKYTAFLPYVNSIRLLSIKEGIFHTSTIERIQILQQYKDYKELLKDCEEYFIQLLHHRISLIHSKDYDDTHYLNVKELSREERKRLKKILKEGKRLHDEVIAIVSTHS